MIDAQLRPKRIDLPSLAGFSAWFAQTTVSAAALITMSARSRQSFRRIGWHWCPMTAYGWVAILTVGLVAAAGGFALLSGGLNVFAADHLEAGGAQPAIFAELSCVFAFAEEFGWRGFLLQHLLPLGTRRALLVSGSCWFVWELPLVVFGILDAKMISVNLPLTIALHVVQTLSAGIALGYLRLRFNSIVLPTFAHGLLNTLGGLIFLYFSEGDPFIGDFAGYFGTGMLAALAVWLLARLPRL